jgi:hypothetical protein
LGLSIPEFSIVELSEANLQRRIQMTNTFMKSAILFGAIGLAGGATGQDVTDMEREQAVRYLAESRAGVIEAVKGLSEAQFNFKPAPDRWSIAETLEHIAMVEDAVLTGVRARLEKGPAPAADRDAKQVDAMILEKVPDRSMKVQAPPQLSPTGHTTPAASLERFLQSRQQMVNWLKSDSDLRGHVVDHPVFGPWDGYQWILAAAGHSERHTKQILEVQADPNFPK